MTAFDGHDGGGGDGDDEEPRRCPRGHVIAPEAQRCHSCYAHGGPRAIGDYALLEMLGRGAHGKVYKARHVATGQVVALKVIESGEPEREVRSHVRLAHDHVVPIFDASGLYHDPPFFTMQLIEGGTLATRRAEFSEPRRALRLVIQLAEAIDSAHRHGVLHRDLKPTNILIDDKGRARISDFSVAKEIGGGAEPAPSQTLAGTLPYMSPEQAGCIAQDVTTQSDVYGLGAILYELLTGEPPRPVDTLEELRASFAARDWPAPIARKGVSEDLKAVCMRALSKDTDDRYASAALLAADLRSVSIGEWPAFRTPTPAQRLTRWVSRNRWLTASIALGAVLLVAFDVSTLDAVSDQQAELQQRMLKVNAALAKAQAQAAVGEFERYRERVARTIESSLPLLESYLMLGPETPNRPELALEIAGFDSLFVAGCDGFIRAHSFDEELRRQFPNGPPGYFERSYTFRDYFQGATALGRIGSRKVYMSRAFRSTWDGRLKFAFSAPIYSTHAQLEACLPSGGGPRMVGVFFAGWSASSALGKVQIRELEGSGQTTALFGPRDRDEAGQPLPDASAFHVIVHEKLRLGDERRMDPHLALRLSERFGSSAPPGRQFESVDVRPYKDSNYIDTLDDSHGRWLGGFYPVGRTGFVIGVQTAYGKATAPVRSLGMLPLINVAFLAYCASALYVIQSRRSRRRSAA